MKYIQLAIKNLTRKKIRTILLAGAVGFGIYIVIMINAFSAGILDNFLNNYSNFFYGHLQIMAEEKLANERKISLFREDNKLLEEIQSLFPDIRMIAKRTSTAGTFINAGNSMQQFIVGIDFDKEQAIKDLIKLQAGSLENMQQEQGVVIPQVIAEGLQARVGDEVMVKLKTVSGQQNAAEFRIAAIISENMGTFSALGAYVNKAYLNKVCNIKENEYTELNVYFSDGMETEARAVKLYNRLKAAGFPLLKRPEDTDERAEVRASLAKNEWQGPKYDIYSLDENFGFVFVMAGFLDGAGLAILLALLGLIAVGILNTFRIIIYERMKEIGTIRALGMQRNNVRLLFILESLLISLAGLLAGMFLALLTAWGLSMIYLGHAHNFLAMFLVNGYIFLKINPLQIIGYILLLMGITALASVLPASKAARFEPARAIHDIT
jgi:putative ABC transport system permease protein